MAMVMGNGVMDVERWSRVLASYAGRDKAVRSLYFWLVLHAQRQSSDKFKANLMALARQMSSARLVFRQLNHPSMIWAAIQLSRVKKPIDPTDHGMAMAFTGIYTVYGVVELLAWLGDAKVLNNDSARFYRWCLYLWIMALSVGLCRSLRNLYLERSKDRNQEWLTVLSQGCDLISAIHSLPFASFLWAGKLSTNQAATFSLIASVIGFVKLF